MKTRTDSEGALLCDFYFEDFAYCYLVKGHTCPHAREQHPDYALSERQREVWDSLDTQEWLRPMDIGACDGSHHSSTLNALVRKGFVERKSRSSWGSRGSYVYRRKGTAQ